MFDINLCFLVNQMAKGEKQWIKPGFLAKQKRTEYEMERYKTIKKNNKKMDALQLKRIATSLMGSTQPNRVHQKGKKIRVDDDDYIPSDHEDDTDAESFESVDDEVLYVWPFIFFYYVTDSYIFVNDALLILSLYFRILYWMNKS